MVVDFPDPDVPTMTDAEDHTILDYQRTKNKTNKSKFLAEDGVVSPMRNSSGIWHEGAGGHNSYWTIYVMNGSARRIVKEMLGWPEDHLDYICRRWPKIGERYLPLLEATE